MADIRTYPLARHLRGTATGHVRHVRRGRLVHDGTGLSFYYRPLSAVLSEVPVDDRELPLLFHARTEDFADVTVQATVTYRFSDPGAAAGRLDFSIDPYRGTWRGQPLDQVATLLAELAQQPALDLLARLPLAEALTTGIAPVRQGVADALADD
ncbi:MAG: SPFH domain-containing protein, partial [Streptosporangiaceae bacterium]